VCNSTAKDKAAAKVAVGKMELEKLNGKRLGAQQKMKEVADAAKVTIIPIDKEILVITQIKTKITDFCASVPPPPPPPAE